MVESATLKIGKKQNYVYTDTLVLGKCPEYCHNSDKMIDFKYVTVFPEASYISDVTLAPKDRQSKSHTNLFASLDFASLLRDAANA